VVQEALTNAVKHAAGAAVAVTVTGSEDELRVEVTDTGGSPSAATAAGDLRRSAADQPWPRRPGPHRSAGSAVRLRRHPDRGAASHRRLPRGGGRAAAGTGMTAAAGGTEPLRVVIADDQALVRTGFRMILTADGSTSSPRRRPAPKRSTRSAGPFLTWC
jgi:hypothetical protein